MSQQRTTQDVYAMVVPNTPLQGEFEEGDQVEIEHRVERLLDHGWIEDFSEHEDGTFTGTLTEIGAAIMNYFDDKMEEHKLGEELDRGAGNFVDSAVRKYAITEYNDWNVISVKENEIVVTDNDGNRRTYQAAEG